MSYATGTRAYCISYDLKKPGRDYSGLFTAIKQAPKWWHYLQSTWLIVTEESATEIWNRLAKQVDPNDYVLVIEVRDNVQGWLPKEAWDWIHANVPSA